VTRSAYTLALHEYQVSVDSGNIANTQAILDAIDLPVELLNEAHALGLRGGFGDDLLRIGVDAGLDRHQVSGLIDETQVALGRWGEFADAAAVPLAERKRIAKLCLRA
jgi:hypothetical protein